MVRKVTEKLGLEVGYRWAMNGPQKSQVSNHYLGLSCQIWCARDDESGHWVEVVLVP